MLSNHLILCRPLLLPSIFPSVRVFSNESVLHIRLPKDWSFSVSISPFNEYSGLTSFRMDWLDLLAVQGTLKSLLQHHRSEASILWRSAFFMVQLSRPYMTTFHRDKQSASAFFCSTDRGLSQYSSPGFLFTFIKSLSASFFPTVGVEGGALCPWGVVTL